MMWTSQKLWKLWINWLVKVSVWLPYQQQLISPSMRVHLPYLCQQGLWRMGCRAYVSYGGSYCMGNQPFGESTGQYCGVCWFWGGTAHSSNLHRYSFYNRTIPPWSQTWIVSGGSKVKITCTLLCCMNEFIQIMRRMRIKQLMTSTYTVFRYGTASQTHSCPSHHILHASKPREYQHSTDSNGTLIDGSC